MAKFRCVTCNDPIELNQYRGFKARDHRCKCGGTIEPVYNCEFEGKYPQRIKTSTCNTWINPTTNRYYFNAWRNRKMEIFLINTSGKFEKLTQEDAWVINGRKFGYPDCCIQEFCEQKHNTPHIDNENDKDRIRASVMNGVHTGFIPCLSHAKQILSGEIKLRDLIKDRYPGIEDFPIP